MTRQYFIAAIVGVILVTSLGLGYVVRDVSPGLALLRDAKKRPRGDGAKVPK
jgi:hypothetical protein